MNTINLAQALRNLADQIPDDLEVEVATVIAVSGDMTSLITAAAEGFTPGPTGLMRVMALGQMSLADRIDHASEEAHRAAQAEAQKPKLQIVGEMPPDLRRPR